MNILEEIMRHGKVKEDLDLEYKAPENLKWQLGIFELKKRAWKIYRDKHKGNMDLSIDPREKTLLICWDFSEDEIKTLLVE